MTAMVGTYIKRWMWWIRTRITQNSAASSTNGDRTRRQQQQADRERTAIDVEMAERVHEVLEKERRTRGEYQQRHVLVIEAEGSPEQLNEQAKRDQPHHAAEREYQPYRHL